MRRRSFLRTGLGTIGGLAVPGGFLASCLSPRAAVHDEPPPWAAGLAPAALVGRGYQLVFTDEFDGPLDIGPDNHRWCPRIWYDPAAEDRQYGIRDSCLYLRCFRDNDWRDCHITTEWANTRSGIFFKGGYFEARIKCAKGWNAFWLFSVSHSRSVPKLGPENWAGEIDILETDSARPSRFYGTLHSNTGGEKQGGPPDRFNRNFAHEAGTQLLDQWHTYAALWTRDEIVWFLDDREIGRCPAFESTWQEMFLIFDLVKGGVDGGPMPSPEIDMIEMLVDWVRVWQRPDQGDVIRIWE